jgi:hypothetical protein
MPTHDDLEAVYLGCVASPRYVGRVWDEETQTWITYQGTVPELTPDERARLEALEAGDVR